jgi:hypothetical protein
LTDDETIEEPLQIEEPPQEEPSHEGFKIESLEDLRRVLVIAQGGNPDAQQSINDFLKFDNNIERTNLPTRRDVVLMAYLKGCGSLFYPEDAYDPFSIIADALSIAFMAKGGEKSKQFVELMKQTPSLVDLQTMGSGETPKGGIMNRIFGGSKE